MKAELGRLQRVDPRDVWETEAGSFTPWLATEGNLALLGDTIGLDLELEGTERNVGLFRADILCKDTTSGNWVLIENQLARTDHSHLGQLITYAAGLKAVTVVWIAAPFTAEHRAALDWMNEVTREGIDFFGLEIELFRIGDSAPAPKFNVVSKPNDWSESVSTAADALARGELTETKQLQLEYWTALADLLRSAGATVKPGKPLPQHWATYALGRSAVYLTAVVNTLEHRIGVHVTVSGDYAKQFYAQLLAQRDEIEREFGEPLEWRELPQRKESQIGLTQASTDPAKKSDWPAQHAWLRDKLERMHAVFSRRVKSLVATDDSPAPALTAGDVGR